MLNRTIIKIYPFVIFLPLLSLLFAGCFKVSSGNIDDSKPNGAPKGYAEPHIVGTIKSKEITESSGIAASRCLDDVLWTHNDSGDDALLYALDKSGKKLGTWKVSGAKNVDWEDIAAFRDETSGRCFLYIGDIGDNEKARKSVTIYRVSEPQGNAESIKSSKNKLLLTEKSQAFVLKYPDAPHDAEALLVHPLTGDLYILTKSLTSASGVYKLPAAKLAAGSSQTLTKIVDLTVPAVPSGFLTGGDIAPDGRSVIICDYYSAYELSLPAAAVAAKFDEIWKQKPLTVLLGTRQQGEAVGYASDGKSIFATSEKLNSPLIEVKRK